MLYESIIILSAFSNFHENNHLDRAKNVTFVINADKLDTDGGQVYRRIDLRPSCLQWKNYRVTKLQSVILYNFKNFTNFIP